MTIRKDTTWIDGLAKQNCQSVVISYDRLWDIGISLPKHLGVISIRADSVEYALSSERSLEKTLSTEFMFDILMKYASDVGLDLVELGENRGAEWHLRWKARRSKLSSHRILAHVVVPCMTDLLSEKVF